MDVVVKGRHIDVSERFRSYVQDKLAKVERFDHKVIRIDVEVIHEANPRLAERAERVELTCRSRGPVVRAEAAARDCYAALDLAYAKLEERLRRSADRRHGHRATRPAVAVPAEADAPRLAAGMDATPRAAGGPPDGAVERDARPDGLDETAAGLITSRLGVQGDGPLVVREKVHDSPPMTLDQALLEMELVGHDFYLFWDKDVDRASVVYRRRGYDYGVLRLRR